MTSGNDEDDKEKDARVQTAFLQKFTWRKVTGPKPWKPKEGDELAGFYGGKTVKNGKFGQYAAVFVRVPGRGIFMVTGTRIIQLIDAAMVEIGAPIHITYGGKKDIGDDKKMNLFDLQVAETNPIEEYIALQEKEFIQ